MIETHIIEILTSLKDEVRQRYKAELTGVFGSYARDEATEDSDIDILVGFDELERQPIRIL